MARKNNMTKPVHLLTPDDLLAFPVWEYDLSSEGSEGRDETWVRPVEQYPVTDLATRVIGVSVALNNGSRMVACLGNVELGSAVATREFLTLGLWHQEAWLDLARYFDVDYARRGPEAISRILGLPVAEIFPIHYDISEHATGLMAVLRSTVEAEPQRRLTESERMELILQK